MPLLLRARTSLKRILDGGPRALSALPARARTSLKRVRLPTETKQNASQTQHAEQKARLPPSGALAWLLVLLADLAAVAVVGSRPACAAHLTAPHPYGRGGGPDLRPLEELLIGCGGVALSGAALAFVCGRGQSPQHSFDVPR